MITTGNQSQSSGLTYLRRKLRAWKICSQFRWEKSGCTYHREEMCNGANVIQSRIKAGKRVGLLKIRMAYGRWYAPQVRRVYSSRSYTVLALVCSVLVHVYSCKLALHTMQKALLPIYIVDTHCLSTSTALFVWLFCLLFCCLSYYYCASCSELHCSCYLKQMLSCGFSETKMCLLDNVIV